MAEWRIVLTTSEIELVIDLELIPALNLSRCRFLAESAAELALTSIAPASAETSGISRWSFSWTYLSSLWTFSWAMHPWTVRCFDRQCLPVRRWMVLRTFWRRIRLDWEIWNILEIDMISGVNFNLPAEISDIWERFIFVCLFVSLNMNWRSRKKLIFEWLITFLVVSC